MLGRWMVARAFAHLTDGRLTVIDEKRRLSFGSSTPALAATLTVRDPGAWWRVATGGTIGAAETYAAGAWQVDDLTAAVRLFARNRDALSRMDGALARLAQPVRQLQHVVRRNTRRGSRRNIAAHYDLGNDFFARVLDPTMQYSCARFATPDSSLHDASVRKIDGLCRALALQPGDRLLDIGGGWGGLAIHAARAYGARVVMTTISRAQHAWAAGRIHEAGLSSQIDVIDADYRDLRSLGRTFDHVVSVEMIEAVGLPYIEHYFNVCRDLLKPGGRLAIQAIVIADSLFETYRRSVDFIQHAVFPGGFLPSLDLLNRSVAQTDGLALADVEDVTEHYPLTLRAWRTNLQRHWDDLRAHGYPESMLRMWEFYLCYSEGGFAERTIGTTQLLIERVPC